MKKITVFILIILSLLLLGFYVWLKSVNNYKINGQFEIAFNEKPVTINRDTNGIAYVFAENKADLIRGQGFVLAQDRLFQIEFYRAFIKGELAGILGESMLDSDIKMRVINIPENAQKSIEYLDKASIDFLQWYCEGFNEYLNVGKNEFPIELDLLGLEPKPLAPVDLVAVIHFIGYTQARNFEDEILSLNLAAGMQNAKELLPINNNPDRTKKLIYDSGILSIDLENRSATAIKPIAKPLIPAPQLGSNNWAIASEKSKSGKPIVVNDPHLDARMLPGIFYPIGLFCPEFKAIGVAIPGIPGIIVGRNEFVAFGVTNAYGDSQDLFIEETKEDTYIHQGKELPFVKKKEIIQVKDDEDVEIEVRSTVRGPIISDFDVFGILTSEVVSFCWSSAISESPSLGIEQFLQAKNKDDFSKAIENIDLMFFNFVYADVHGNIAHQSTGLIPKRANYKGRVPQKVNNEDVWQGFIPKSELPNMKNPERGWVGTANHDTRPDDYPYYYSSHFSPDYRYKRIKEVLSENQQFDSENMWDLLLDCKNKQAEKLLPIFIEALKDYKNEIDLVEILKEWNYNDHIDEVGATIYHTLYNTLVSLILEDELPDNIETSFWLNRYYWAQRMDSIIISNHAFIDNVHTTNKETLSELITIAANSTIEILRSRLGPDPKKWNWAKMHPVRFFSPLKPKGLGSSFLGAETFAKNGSNETLNRGGYNKTDSVNFETEWFSSFRMVADLNDAEKINAVLSGGSAARIFHPSYKSQLEAWKNETWIPYWFTKEKVKQHAKHELILN